MNIIEAENHMKSGIPCRRAAWKTRIQVMIVTGLVMRVRLNNRKYKRPMFWVVEADDLSADDWEICE